MGDRMSYRFLTHGGKLRKEVGFKKRQALVFLYLMIKLKP